MTISMKDVKRGSTWRRGESFWRDGLGVWESLGWRGKEDAHVFAVSVERILEAFADES